MLMSPACGGEWVRAQDINPETGGNYDEQTKNAGRWVGGHQAELPGGKFGLITRLS
jgi:hypothetical protein